MMAWKKLLVVVVLLSAILGVDAISEKRTKKLYRKAGRWQQKLRGVWALLGVKPFLVQPGEEGDECVLKSKVEEDYVLKGADVVTQAQLDEAVVAAKSCGDEAFTIAGLRADVDMMTEALAAKDDEIAAIGRGIVANYMSNDVVEANYVLKTDLDAAVAAATADLITEEQCPTTDDADLYLDCLRSVCSGCLGAATSSCPEGGRRVHAGRRRRGPPGGHRFGDAGGWGHAGRRRCGPPDGGDREAGGARGGGGREGYGPVLRQPVRLRVRNRGIGVELHGFRP